MSKNKGRPNKAQRYKRNMRTIRGMAPALADWIEKAPQLDWAEEISTGRGKKPNLLIHQGRDRLAAYDVENPWKEPLNVARNHNLEKGDTTVLIGLGLGYLLRALLNHAKPGHRFLIVEPVGTFLRWTLQRMDLSNFIQDGTVNIAIDREGIGGAVALFEEMGWVENWIVLREHYTISRPEYDEIAAYTTDVINQARCNTGTVMGNGARIAQNDIEALPYLLPHQGVKGLTGLFQGLPVVVVSTGPSLDRNIHVLKEHQDKVVIVAVAQALRPLLGWGITPDFIVTVDFGEVNMNHLKGLFGLSETIPLVALNRTYAPLIQSYQGPIFISASPQPGFEGTSVNIFEDCGHIGFGGSVAHMAFGLARLLGGDPIIFMGQDLALSDLSHSTQADSGGRVSVDTEGNITWEVLDPRCSLYGKPSSMGPEQWTPGYWGGMVRTNVGLASFLLAFKSLVEEVKKDGVKVYNCTEGGAAIPGTIARPLLTVLGGFSHIDGKPSRLVEKGLVEAGGYPGVSPDKLDREAKVIPLLKRELELLETIKANSHKGLATCRGLETIARRGNGKGLKRLFQKNQEFAVMAQAAAMKSPLVYLSVFGAQRAIMTRALRVQGNTAHLLENQKDLLTRIDRSRLILQAAHDSATQLIPYYQETLECIHTDVLGCFPDEEPLGLPELEACLDAGYWAKPLLVAQEWMDNYWDAEFLDGTPMVKIYDRAIEQRVKAHREAHENYKEGEKLNLLHYLRLIEDAQALGRDAQDYDGALIMLMEALPLFPDRPEALWGVSTVLVTSGKLDAAVDSYRKLVSLFPDEPQFEFELYVVEIKARYIEGIDHMREFISRTGNKYQAFRSHLGNVLFVEQNRPKEAIEQYREYLQHYPADYDIWTCLGGAYIAEENWIEAETAFQSAFRIKPGFPPALRGYETARKRGKR